MTENYDVAIIGGGPAGSTVGSFLKKYNPSFKVVILERERFPRDHVGESLLPVVSNVLDELGVWDKVEAANFPIKIGATYRWGRTDDLWDFEFLPDGKLEPQLRPARFEGQRRKTAFQVDRAVYDKVLLDHSESLGCIVRQETAVRSVLHENDRVTGLILGDGSEITARYYVDASGHAGILRRTMGVHVECPTLLQNIAIWDYWQNTEWAVSIGVGGTRVQVLSQPYGWIWFIPLGPDRTSIGLIVPASYYKEQGKQPEELYLEAVQSDPLVSQLIKSASRENHLSTTKDWSFVSERLTGENWFLAGESAGFADPILAAGLSLAHVGSRDVAYVILALDREDFEPEWLCNYYCSTHRNQIRQHIRFADFWYSANGVFSDLKDHAKLIAEEAGLELTSDKAWQWLGQGGFIERDSGTSLGGVGLLVTKQIIASFTGEEQHYEIVGKTHFLADLEGAERDWTGYMRDGKITRLRMYRRDGKVLPMVSLMKWLTPFLKTERTFEELAAGAHNYALELGQGGANFPRFRAELFAALEGMVSDGWVRVRTEPGTTAFPRVLPDVSHDVHPNRDEELRTG